MNKGKSLTSSLITIACFILGKVYLIPELTEDDMTVI